MKKSLIFKFPFNMSRSLVLMGLISLMFIKTSAGESIQAGVSFQIFYDELLPYGDWVHDPVHGYVWVPYAEPNFQPYGSNGYWIMTSYGNTWVSNYDWGWAPFHYGRWYFDDYLGWAWLPGYEWGPAWVNWRAGAGYYGWAPLGPGIHINIAVNIPSHHWVFVPRNRLISRNIYNYYIPRRTVYKVYNQTTIINNTYVSNNRTYISGPERREIERVTRRSVPVYQVNNSSRPGRASVGRNAVEVYRPEVRQTGNNSRSSQPKPSRVVTAREHKAIISSRSAASAVPGRTVRTNSGRETEHLREVGTSNRSAASRDTRTETRVNNNKATSRDTQQRTASPEVQRNAPAQPSRVNTSRERKDSPSPQPQNAVRQRTRQAPTQNDSGNRSVRPANTNKQVQSQTAPKSRSVQPARSSSQVRSQDTQRSRSTTLSPSGSRESSNGAASRGSSNTRGSSRRGN